MHADGQVYDLDRISFLRNYLRQLQRATAEGVPVRGYFLWSLMDNFEWIFGFEKRFGLYHVDFETQRPDRQTQRGLLSRGRGAKCDRRLSSIFSDMTTGSIMTRKAWRTGQSLAASGRSNALLHRLPQS